MRPFSWLSTVAIGLIVLASLAAAKKEKGTPFEAAMAAVKSNLAAPDGKRYDEEFGRWFAEHHTDSMVRCTKSAKPEDLKNFDLLVRVSGEGKAEEVLVNPETTVARCLADDVRKGISVRPPSPSYWVRVEMQIRP